MTKTIELPFRFEGDPVMTAKINGDECARCVLDTGAAVSTVRIPQGQAFAGLHPDANGPCILDSLEIDSFDFGPLRVRIKFVPGLRQPEMYLGSDLLQRYCLIMDYAGGKAVLSSDSYLDKRGGASSTLGFFRGRPIVYLEIGGREKRFVLDTGSNGNWIFYKSQTEALLGLGQLEETNTQASCGLGDISVQRSLLLPKLSLGGVSAAGMRFLLAGEEAFGGLSATLEDGIIGTGEIAAWHRGVQVLDFLSRKFLLR